MINTIKCLYCKKEFLSPQALGSHKVWCKENLNPDIEKQKEIKKNIKVKIIIFMAKNIL